MHTLWQITAQWHLHTKRTKYKLKRDQLLHKRTFKNINYGYAKATVVDNGDQISDFSPLWNSAEISYACFGASWTLQLKRMTGATSGTAAFKLQCIAIDTFSQYTHFPYGASFSSTYSDASVVPIPRFCTVTARFPICPSRTAEYDILHWPRV